MARHTAVWLLDGLPVGRSTGQTLTVRSYATLRNTLRTHLPLHRLRCPVTCGAPHQPAAPATSRRRPACRAGPVRHAVRRLSARADWLSANALSATACFTVPRDIHRQYSELGSIVTGVTGESTEEASAGGPTRLGDAVSLRCLPASRPELQHLPHAPLTSCERKATLLLLNNVRGYACADRGGGAAAGGGHTGGAGGGRRRGRCRRRPRCFALVINGTLCDHSGVVMEIIHHAAALGCSSSVCSCLSAHSVVRPCTQHAVRAAQRCHRQKLGAAAMPAAAARRSGPETPRGVEARGPAAWTA